MTYVKNPRSNVPVIILLIRSKIEGFLLFLGSTLRLQGGIAASGKKASPNLSCLDPA